MELKVPLRSDLKFPFQNSSNSINNDKLIQWEVVFHCSEIVNLFQI